MSHFNVDFEKFLEYLATRNKTKYKHLIFLPVWFKHLCHSKRVRILATNQHLEVTHSSFVDLEYRKVTEIFSNLPTASKIDLEELEINSVFIYCQDIITKNIFAYTELELEQEGDATAIYVRNLATITSDITHTMLNRTR